MTVGKAPKNAVRVFEKVRGYLNETRGELKKVVWPDRRYVTVATVIICIVVVAMGLFVMAVDFSFAKIMGYLEKAF
jgi:preprotein translocase subunit SecE